MRLNADIIYEHLSASHTVWRWGPGEEELVLGRPVFYQKGMERKAPRIYLTESFDHLDNLPKNSCDLFIATAEKYNGQWKDTAAAFFYIAEAPSLIELFNEIENTFDFYEAWDEKLQYIVSQDADIKKIVGSSIEIFGNAMIVNNKNLKVIAETVKNSEGQWEIQSGRYVNQPDKVAIEKIYQNDIKKFEEPLLYNFGEISKGDGWTYRINFFTSNRYNGCTSLIATTRSFRGGDFVLFRRFGRYIKEALLRRSSAAPDPSSSTKSLIKDLLNSIPVDEYRLQSALNADAGPLSAPPKQWICFKIHRKDNDMNLPLGYLYNVLEESIRGAIVVMQGGDITAFTPVDNGDHSLAHHLATISRIFHDSDFCMGVSNTFANLIDARAYYRQAGCALEVNGESKERFCFFQTNALTYMMIHCRGEFSYDVILSPGLQKLRRYSQETGIDYWETLKIYFDNEMNATQTAKDLYLHRSTLLQRLERIRYILGHDFSDPEERLYLRLCLHMPQHTNDCLK